MQLTTKEAVCSYINSKVTAKTHPGADLWKVPFLGGLFPYFFAIPKVHVPIYDNPWKIKALQTLERKIYAWHPRHDLYEMKERKEQGWPCQWDLSKFIRPDQWRTYWIKPPVAIPNFTAEYEHCWVIQPQQEFYKENLSYGVRPMAIFEQLVDIGGGHLWLVEKEHYSIYEPMVSFFSYDSAIEDFKHFLEQQPCSINWKEQQIA